MNIALVQFAPWDKIYYFKQGEIKIQKGYYVIVQTEFGHELGEVIDIKKMEDIADEAKKENQSDLKGVIRLATKDDFNKINKPKEKEEALKYCKMLATKYSLPMKLVDVRFSYESNRITFAFIADGRIDFREMVKELTKHYNSMIRLHQIGIRDEAKMRGDCGHCGMPLCCKKFLGELSSITSDMADLQQCAHRGSDRISGICGRLMCCLAYENEGYRYLTEKLPKVGDQIRVGGKKAVVLSQNPMKRTVNVELLDESGEGKAIIEVDLSAKK